MVTSFGHGTNSIEIGKNRSMFRSSPHTNVSQAPVVETEHYIYMIETKAANEMTNEEVLMKKQAAEEYCRNATEYNLGNDGKAWKYVLIPHDKINKASNFSFLVATN